MQRIIDYYNRYNEDERLIRDNYHRTEFLLTLKLLEPYIMPGSRILDIGAGTGRYSFYYAENGHQVTALDLTPKHVDMISSKASEIGLAHRLSAVCGDILDGTSYADQSFDVVLCMGPLYHHSGLESWRMCISECMRVLKPNGIFVAAYVNRAGAYLYKIKCNLETITAQPPMTVFDHNSHLVDGCFTSSSPSEVEKVMRDFPLRKKEHAATDGVSAIMHESVNQMNPQQFDKWLEYLYLVNRDVGHLGTSLHNLYIAEKITHDEVNELQP